MTEEELKAIEERANKATSGPWYWHQAPGFGADCFLRSRTDKTYSEYTYIASGMSGFANCEFIAHSREDIPKLIKALREARGTAAGAAAKPVAKPGSLEDIEARRAELLRKHKETCQGCCPCCGDHCPEEGGTSCGGHGHYGGNS